MAEVKFSGTSDFEKVKKDYEALAKHTAKVESENQKLKKTSDQVGDSYRKVNRNQKSMLQSGADGARGLVDQYVGARAALIAFNAEMAHGKRMAEESATRTMSMASAETAVLKNLGDVSDKAARDFLDATKQVAAKTGMPSAIPVLQTASSILSATGGDQKKTLEILGVVSPMMRDQPDEMARYGGAMGDVMKNSGMNARQAAAFMGAAQGQARFEELSQFKEVAPALAATASVTRGDKVQNAVETAALFAGIGSKTGDVEGSITKGAVSALVINLQEVASKLDTTFERLEYVRKNPKLHAKVLQNGFRGATVPVIRDLLSSADTEVSQMVADAAGKIKADEPAFARKLNQVSSLTPAIRLAGSSQRAEGNIERTMLAPSLATEGVAHKIMSDALARTHGGDGIMSKVFSSVIDDWWSELEFTLGTGTSTQRAIEQLEYRKATLAGRLAGIPSSSGNYDMTGASSETKRMVQLLEEQVAILKSLQAGEGTKTNANRRAQQLERQGVATE